VDTDAVLGMLKEVADEVINPRFRSLESGEIHEKAPGDLVTDADREAEIVITARLRKEFPDAVVLGEEAFADDPASLGRYSAAAHAFTVDPIDGTKNFVNGSRDHATMMSESRNGEVVRAWIWQPQHQLAYVAELGAGAFRNGERLQRPAAATEPAAWRPVTSRRRWVGRDLPGLRPFELTWICCGVDYPHLVEGAADVVLYGPPRPWDHAPGGLLLTEAGGYLGSSDGRDYLPQGPEYPGLLAAADRATYLHVVALMNGSVGVPAKG
jgi:fructose-1,6-bisphosphatase/inositol monophosphatase family enzyme